MRSCLCQFDSKLVLKVLREKNARKRKSKLAKNLRKKKEIHIDKTINFIFFLRILNSENIDRSKGQKFCILSNVNKNFTLLEYFIANMRSLI